MIRLFLAKISAFLIIPSFFWIVAAAAIPPTPRASTSHLFAELDKNSLLQNTPSPRLILVGGSNLSFGINSQLIKDALNVNPVNTGIDFKLGLKYMMDSTTEFVKPGDIVVLVPEYDNFYGSTAYGKEELLRTVFDVDQSNTNSLSLKQWLNIVVFLPKFSLSKLNPSEYIFEKDNEIGVYERRAFNQYGDVHLHWTLEREEFLPYEPISEEFNNDVIEQIAMFQKEVRERGAVLYITFPCLQDISFENRKNQILEVENRLRENRFLILGTPKKYKMPDQLMFNTPYHLLKEGVDIRTRLLIDDIRRAQLQNAK